MNARRHDLRDHGRHGFTLIEIIVALVSASVLALTAGLMIYYAFLAWTRVSDTVEVQRDASLASYMICRRIRGAMVSEVTSPGQGLSADVLAIPPRAFYPAGSDLAYNPAGRMLVYDPDTDPGSVDDEVVLVNNRLDSFVCTHVTNGIRVSLDLSGVDDDIHLDTVAFFRNEPN